MRVAPLCRPYGPSLFHVSVLPHGCRYRKEVQVSPEQVLDTLDCGNAQENWQSVIRLWKTRAVQARGEATRLLADAQDAQERAAEFDEDARNFDAIASALENAPVTFHKGAEQ